MNLFRKNKVTELTSEEKINASIEQVNNALGMFTKIYSDLEEANTALNETVMKDKTELEKLNNNISLANSEMKSNMALQEKIKPFIKEQQ